MCMSCGILIAYSSSTKSDRSLRHFLFLAREHWAYFAAFIIHLFDSCIFANSRYESTIPSAPSLSIQHDIFNLPVASPTRRTAHTHSQFSESEISIFLLYRFGVNTCVHLTHIFVRNEWHRFESRASNAKPRWMIHENGAASDFSNGHISIVCVRCVHVQAYTIFSERTENWEKNEKRDTTWVFRQWRSTKEAPRLSLYFSGGTRGSDLLLERRDDLSVDGRFADAIRRS